MRFFLGVKKWQLVLVLVFLTFIGINYVTSELRENSELRRDLNAAERAREVTIKAFKDRDIRIREDQIKAEDIQKVISNNEHKNRPLSHLMRAYVDSLR